MLAHKSFLLVFGIVLGTVSASLQVVLAATDRPLIKLPYAQYRGATNDTSGLTYFLGMRYAAAPIGGLRFNVPHPPDHVPGIQPATSYGAACIQQNLSNVTIPGVGPFNAGGGIPSNQSEDCLFINVIRPTNIPRNTKLPVVFWIYGGGFQIGDTAQSDSASVLQRSIALGEPVIYVSANYRLNAYGFLASKEIQSAGTGNMGLRDQRYALQWVHDNIYLFGGDEHKVTLWGPSAGAISVSLHLIANQGEAAGLFRGGVMNSGSPLPMAGMEAGQPYYDILTRETGCSNMADTLNCLRGVPAKTLTSVIQNKTPNLFSFQGIQSAYQPRVDGDFIQQNPWDSIRKGAYARVPFITGDSRDEGTLFALSQSNISTSVEALDYVHKNFFPNASATDIEEIGKLYPDDPAAGSPFGTGNASNLYPQFKRLSAMEGDFFFQGPRRNFIEVTSKTQNVWVFAYKRTSALSRFLGTSHGADSVSFGYSATISDFQGLDAVINFANHLTPVPDHQNSSLSSVEWPIWGNEGKRNTLTFWDPEILNITSDTEREDSIHGAIELMRKFPLGFSKLPISV